MNGGISLFVEQCLPLARHDRRVPGPGLAPIKLWPQEETWFDPRSGWLPTRSKGGCSIEDTLRPLTMEDQDRRAALAAGMVSSKLPVLEAEADNGSFGFDLMKYWVQYPRGDKRRWGVELSRSTSHGPGSDTLLKISQPPEPITP